MSPMLLLAQGFEDYLIKKVNDYRLSNEVAELKKSDDDIHYENMSYCFDVSETIETNKIDSLYEYYFNTNASAGASTNTPIMINIDIMLLVRLFLLLIRTLSFHCNY